MRILHTSDWHLGKSLEQINRIEEQWAFVDCLCTIVEERKVDLVLIAGDIYDTYNPSAAAEELFYEAVERLNGKGARPVVVIAGNHDNPERLCAASALTYKDGIVLLGYPASDAGEYWPKRPEAADTHKTAIPYATASGGIILADSGPGWLELGIPGCEHHAVILTMPYPSEARLEEVLSREAEEGVLQKAYSEKIGSIFARLAGKFRDDTVNLIVAHLFLLGGSTSDSERTLQVGGAMTVNPGVLPENAHFAALGHLHRPQEIRNAPCPVYYAGSPLAYSFSEADYSKAVYLVDAVPGKKAEVTPVYLDCGKPLTKWVAEEGIGQVLKWCEDGRDQNAWIDLEIVTDRVLTTEEQKSLRSLHSGIVNIRPRLMTGEVDILPSQSREGKKIDELFSDYYKYRMGVEIRSDLMAAFIEVLNDEEEVDAGEAEGLPADGSDGLDGFDRMDGLYSPNEMNSMNGMNGEVAADETEAS
jgi:exonuclease SbcD